MNENNIYGFSSEEERKLVLARLQAAAWMGVISSPDLEAVEERRKQKNAEIEKRLAKGEAVYGLTHYTPAMYLQYELTRFKLDYTVHAKAFLDQYSKNISHGPCFYRGGGTCPAQYSYREITEEEKKAFYEENKDLFTRYFGDSFAYDEVSMIIEKRLREMEYESIIQDLLC